MFSKASFSSSASYCNTVNSTISGMNALYNGNISESYWKTSADNVLRKYNYGYDHLNRLLNAVYQKPNNAVPITNSYNESLTYDKNGNVTTLQRTGEYDDSVYNLQTDNLAYYYSSTSPNQLLKVTDTTNNPNGFKDNTTTGNDYSYDANGNLIYDTNKADFASIINTCNLLPS